MNLAGIATKAGASTSCIEKLIKDGEGSIRLANRIGTSRDNITKFVEGTVSPGIASALGANRQNAQDLRDKIGREGAIGIIIGLACGMECKKGDGSTTSIR